MQRSWGATRPVSRLSPLGPPVHRHCYYTQSSMILPCRTRTARARSARLLGATAIAAMIVAVTGQAVADGDPQSTAQRLQAEQAQLRQQLAAAQTSDAQVQADVSRLDAITSQQRAAVGAANSQLADAEAQVAVANQQLATKTAELQRTTHHTAAERDLLRRQALAAYMEGSTSASIDSLFASNAEQAVVTAEYRSIAMGNVSDTVDRLHQLQDVLAAQRADLQAAEHQAQAAAAAAATRAQAANRAALAAQQAAATQQAAHATLQARIAQFGAESADLAAQQSQVAAVIAQSTASNLPAGEGTTPSAGVHPGGLAWPLQGAVTSEYGPRWGGFHPGIDIADPTGTPIHAASAGQIIYAGWESGYGNFVLVDHGGGIVTGYAHQSEIAVTQGQAVAQGQVIGFVGSTGDSTGPHLHFEVRVNGSTENPRDYVTGSP